MPLLKRPAAVAVATQPKVKQQKVDPLAEKCDAIASVLAEAQGYAEPTLQMLATSVKSCLMIKKEERHQVQNAVIEMISEVLSSIEAGHAEKVAAIQAKISDADAEKESREGEAEAAAKAQKDKAEAVTVAEATAEEAKEARLNAKFDHGQATTARKQIDTDLEQASEKKALALSAMTEYLAPLKEGAAESADASIKSLTDVAKKLGLEEQLVATVAVVLRKPVGERAAFDGVVIQQFDQQMNAQSEKFAQQLAKGEASKTEGDEKIQACQAKSEEAEKQRDLRQEELKAAKAALKEAVAAKKAADARVQDWGPEMEEAAANAATAEAVLVACKADLATFQELVDGVPNAVAAPALEVEEVVEPEGSAEA